MYFGEFITCNIFETPQNFVVPRFTGKTRITGKTAEIPERPKNNRETLIGALKKTFID